MRTVIAPHQLLPKGLLLESLSIETGRVRICVESVASGSRCPLCARGSSRVHSRYFRVVSDLPWHGISVTLLVRARRFFCDEVSCERRIFCERLSDVAARARKTSRWKGRSWRSSWRWADAPEQGWPKNSASWSVEMPCSRGPNAPFRSSRRRCGSSAKR